MASEKVHCSFFGRKVTVARAKGHVQPSYCIGQCHGFKQCEAFQQMPKNPDDKKLLREAKEAQKPPQKSPTSRSVHQRPMAI